MEINIIEVFGWLSACFSIILYFSPILKYLKLCKGKMRYNDAPNLKVFGNYITCINWFIYGYLLKNKYFFVCFLSGAFFSIICVFTFLLFLAKIKILKSLIFTGILLGYTLISYLLFVILIHNNDIIGYLCAGFSLIFVINPILLIKKVVKYRNCKLIPIKLCILRLISTTCWIIYGFMIINFYVIIPNFVGMVFSLIVMFIWNILKKRKPVNEEVANCSINNSKNKPGNTITLE